MFYSHFIDGSQGKQHSIEEYNYEQTYFTKKNKKKTV